MTKVHRRTLALDGGVYYHLILELCDPEFNPQTPSSVPSWGGLKEDPCSDLFGFVRGRLESSSIYHASTGYWVMPFTSITKSLAIINMHNEKMG